MEKQILEFLKNDVGVVIINDQEKNFLFGIEKSGLSENAQILWRKLAPYPHAEQRGEVWELYDADNRKYYRITTSSFNSGIKLIQISFMLDVTEYTSVFRNISGISANWEKSSRFQTSLINKLSGDYAAILPDIAKVFRCTGAILYIKSFCGAFIITYKCGELKKLAVNYDDPAFEKRERESYGKLFCYQTNIVGNQSYALFLNTDIGFDENNAEDVNIYNIIRLFIENSLLKEQVVYESEHDKMTGLFNKGKYMSLMEQRFGNPSAIAIYNMDVNNLKYMNDTYGHEMGDRLIIKAAESLKSVQSENIIGFRLGGDEFILVALDITEENAAELQKKWEQEIEKLNKADNSIYLVIASGMAFGKGDYDINGLLAKADKLMYEDKQKKKSYQNKR